MGKGRRRRLPVYLLALMMVLPLWIMGNGSASEVIDQPNDSKSSTVDPNVYLPTEPINGSSPLEPVGFYNNTTRITVLPDGTVIEEGGHKIGDDPGLLDDFIPDIDGRAEIMIWIVGEPALAHEGGAQNTTYLDILHQRHQNVKDQITEQEMNVTFHMDTYLVSNAISANALVSDVSTILTMENVSEVKQTGRFYPALETSVPTIRADDLWSLGLDGSGITIAILDTGIDATHPSLDDRLVAFQDFTDGNPSDFDDPADLNGHGTHVSGIAAGTGDGTPFTGVAPGAHLAVGQVCVHDPVTGGAVCPESFVIAAYDWIALMAPIHNIRVVSMSLGDSINGYGSTRYEDATDLLVSGEGLSVVVAAGNSGSQRHTVGRPGTSKRVITVAASYDEGDDDRTNDYLASFSSRGPTGDFRIKPDVTAPGGKDEICSAFPDGIPVEPEVICFTSPDGIYRLMGGTSMAAPHISGLAALLLQSHPTWQPSQVKAAIINTAQDFTRIPNPLQYAEEPIAQGSGL
ncbi:MAG: S8 family serine peptidase, partial [Thermoplasmata archaeon]|nr:S8 family serine peptidase [Thermoplasmata archaeon]